MPTCPSCGFRFADPDLTYCPRCRAKRNGDQAAADPAPERTSKPTWIEAPVGGGDDQG